MSQINEARAPRRFQFSLVMLLALTGWAAIVCLALKTPTPPWAAAVFLLTMFATLAGGLGILYRTGRARVFAVGFFAGCLSYGACLFVTEKNFFGRAPNESEMPTTTFASWLFDRMHAESASMMGGMMGGGGMGGGGFFSVDSSLGASQDAASNRAAAGGEDPFAAPATGGSSDPFNSVVDLPSADSDGIDQVVPPGAGVLTVPAPTATPVFTVYYFKQFVVIVHSALAMLMGLAGGVIAQVFYAARRDPPMEREAGES